MNHLAAAYNQSGQPQKARALLLQVIQKNNRDLSLISVYSYSCIGTGGFRGRDLLRVSSIELRPDHAQAYVAKANALWPQSEKTNSCHIGGRLSVATRKTRDSVTMGDVIFAESGRREAMEHYQSGGETGSGVGVGLCAHCAATHERGDQNEASKPSTIQKMPRRTPPSLCFKTV